MISVKLAINLSVVGRKLSSNFITIFDASRMLDQGQSKQISRDMTRIIQAALHQRMLAAAGYSLNGLPDLLFNCKRV